MIIQDWYQIEVRDLASAKRKLEILPGGPSAIYQFAPSTAAKAILNLPPGPPPSNPRNGDLWVHDSEQTLDFFLNGIERHLSGSFYDQLDSVTIANTTDERSLFGTGIGTRQLPANFFVPGTTIFAEMRGHVASTGNPTARVRAYLGSTAILDTTALTLGTLTGDEYFRASLKLCCRASGVAGQIAAAMTFEYHQGVGSAALQLLETIPAALTVNTTIPLLLDLTWTWGTANPADTITSIIANAGIQQ